MFLRIFIILFTVAQASAQVYFENISVEAGIEPGDAYIEGHGVSACDFDNDGDIDLFVCTNDALKNHLYVNDGSGFFTEESAERGLDEHIAARASLWFDYNGDHLPDLLIVSDHSGENDFLRLYRQEEDHTFTDVTTASGLTDIPVLNLRLLVGGAAAGDVNNDGYLDLIITHSFGRSLLFINNQDGTFYEIGQRRLSGNTNSYLTPMIFDVNYDGREDILIAVDARENELWINEDNLRFSNKASASGINSHHSDMGIAIGDIENDGDVDVYITNVYGNEVSFNQLFRNDSENGEITFSETARSYGVEKGGWGWGTTFFDADNDGWVDLAESNGYHDVGFRQPSVFLHNNNGNNFTDLSAAAGFTEVLDANSMIALDIDRDGDADLAETARWVSEKGPSVRIFRNTTTETGSSGNYLTIRPRMLGSNAKAIGARVVVEAGELQLTRIITAGISYYAQEPAEAMFGLGNESIAKKVTIYWPGGDVTTRENVAANQVLTITDEDVMHRPKNLRLLFSETNLLEFTWDHLSTREQEYEIERSETSDFELPYTFFAPKGQRSIIDTTDLIAGNTYYYRVRAINESNQSAYSDTIALMPQEYIMSPGDLSVKELSPFSLQLTWDDRSENETSFEIQRADNRFFDSYEQFNTPDTLFTDSTVTPNTRYFYRIVAKNKESQSFPSDYLDLLTPDYITPPAEVSFMRNGSTQIIIRWRDQSSNEDGFIIERALTSNFLYTQSFRVGKDREQYIDRDVMDGIDVYYRVKAFNARTFSAYARGEEGVVTANNVSDNIAIYPNPADERLYISDASAEIDQIVLFNMAGEEVLRTRPKNDPVSLDIIGITSGSYIVMIVTPQREYRYKLWIR